MKIARSENVNQYNKNRKQKMVRAAVIRRLKG